MSNWIYFLLGFLSGIVIMFIFGKIAEFIRIIAIAREYQKYQKKEGGISAEDLQKIKEKFGIAREEKRDGKRS